jgi:hypothetical protein
VDVVGRLGAQLIGIEMHGLQTRGAGAGDIVAAGVADVHGLLRRHAERVERMAEDLCSRLGDAHHV